MLSDPMIDRNLLLGHYKLMIGIAKKFGMSFTHIDDDVIRHMPLEKLFELFDHVVEKLDRHISD